MKKEYYCKWCNQNTSKMHHHLYCDQNPDGPENYKKLRERNKKNYEKYAKPKILRTAHTPEARAKRRSTVKKNWDNGVYDNVDFGEKFKGKAHTISLRLKQSMGMLRFWKKKEPELLEKNLEKHNVILPGFSGYNNKSETKKVIGGEFFEEDFVEYEQEYDPFK